MWRIKAAAVPIAAVYRPVFCSLRAFSAWVSGGIGGASGAVVPVALLVVESECTHWPVAPLLSGLPFANPVRLLPASGGTSRHRPRPASGTHHAKIRCPSDSQAK